MRQSMNRSMPDASPPLPVRARDQGLRQRLVAWRVMALVNVTQKSGMPAYRQATGLSDVEWQIVRQVGVHAPVVLTQIAALLSRDKGQISRTVGRLVAQGLLVRAGRRAPLALSSRGREVYARIVRLAHARNRALTRGLTSGELRALPAMLARLQMQARRLIDAGADRARGTLASRRALLAAQLTDREELRATQRDLPPRERLILPDFINLLNLLRTSATAVFGQTTGLSEFEWQTIAQIGEYGALTLIELVSNMNRDKSQVGRAVKALVAQGHLSAYKIGGGRHVRLVMAQSGQRIYERAARVALKRNAQLLSGLSRAQQQALFATLERIAANAAGLSSGPGTRGA